jgi:hypothetical protein
MTVTRRKQTSATRLNRQLSGTRYEPFEPLLTHRPAHVLAKSHASLATAFFTNHEPPATSNNVELAASAKKQQIREWPLNSLGLYFLAVYAHFKIGRQRALLHNRATKEVAN